MRLMKTNCDNSIIKYEIIIINMKYKYKNKIQNYNNYYYKV